MVMDSSVRNGLCPHTCAVCGDPASGHHYQIPSCNGCKNFFRRAILGMKVFKECPEDRTCLRANSSAVLKRCRACRFSRCVEGGMNPLCLVSSVPVEDNPVVQEVFRQRKELQCSLDPSSSRSPTLTLEKAPTTAEMLANRLIDELAFLERAHEKIRRSCFSPLPEDGIPLAERLQRHSNLSRDYGDMQPGTSTQPPDPGREAPNMLRTPIDRKKRLSCLEKFSKVWPHADLVYSIEYLKTFEVFHRLSAEEQRLLVRWVIVICSHLTASYFSFKMNSNVTYHPDGSTVKITCVMHPICTQYQANPPWESPQKREYHFESIDRIRSLELDEQEYVLLKAMPVTIDGLSDYGRVILEEQRERYAKSLFSYLCARRRPHQAPRQFLDMLKLIDWFRGVNERRKEHHLLRATIGLRPWFCEEDSREKPLLMDEIFL